MVASVSERVRGLGVPVGPDGLRSFAFEEGGQGLDDTVSEPVFNYEEYHPYGTTAWWASDGSTDVSAKRYRYTGKEKDEETGLAYHGARYYAAWLGRWERPDPIGLKGGINRFSYVDGRPTVASDPTGNASYIPQPSMLERAASALISNALYSSGAGVQLATDNIPVLPYYTDPILDNVPSQSFQEGRRAGAAMAVVQGGLEMGAAVTALGSGAAGAAALDVVTGGAAAVLSPAEVAAAVPLVGAVGHGLSTSSQGLLSSVHLMEGGGGPDAYFDRSSRAGSGRSRAPDPEVEKTGLFGEGDAEGVRIVKEGGQGGAPEHHVMTNKNFSSTARGGPWSPRFEEMAKKAGLTLEDAANKVEIPGHAGPHAEGYHKAVFQRLESATSGLAGDEYTAAFKAELDAIRTEASTPDTYLNVLLTNP